MRGRLDQPALELTATRPRRAEHHAPRTGVARLRSSLLDEAQVTEALERPVHERARARPDAADLALRGERAGDCESVCRLLGEKRQRRPFSR